MIGAVLVALSRTPTYGYEHMYIEGNLAATAINPPSEPLPSDSVATIKHDTVILVGGNPMMASSPCYGSH